MTFLVDTCVAIWFFEGSDAIPQKTLGRLVDAGNDVLLSDVSILEIAIKHSIGKFPLLHRDPFDRLLVAQALANGLTLVSPDPLVRQYKVHSLWG